MVLHVDGISTAAAVQLHEALRVCYYRYAC
jgi:hypothetical protein